MWALCVSVGGADCDCAGVYCCWCVVVLLVVVVVVWLLLLCACVVVCGLVVCVRCCVWLTLLVCMCIGCCSCLLLLLFMCIGLLFVFVGGVVCACACVLRFASTVVVCLCG